MGRSSASSTTRQRRKDDRVEKTATATAQRARRRETATNVPSDCGRPCTSNRDKEKDRSSSSDDRSDSANSMPRVLEKKEPPKRVTEEQTKETARGPCRGIFAAILIIACTFVEVTAKDKVASNPEGKKKSLKELAIWTQRNTEDSGFLRRFYVYSEDGFEDTATFPTKHQMQKQLRNVKASVIDGARAREALFKTANEMIRSGKGGRIKTRCLMTALDDNTAEWVRWAMTERNFKRCEFFQMDGQATDGPNDMIEMSALPQVPGCGWQCILPIHAENLRSYFDCAFHQAQALAAWVNHTTIWQSIQQITEGTVDQAKEAAQRLMEKNTEIRRARKEQRIADEQSRERRAHQITESDKLRDNMAKRARV